MCDRLRVQRKPLGIVGVSATPEWEKKSHADMNRCHLSPVESCETRVIITISSLELENLRPRELDHTSE